jgi:hypothetical protein
MSFSTYSFENVDVIWGITEFEEFADGDDIVTIDPTGPQWNMVVGGKGDVVRSQTNDSTGTCSIKLLQTSRTNKFLYAQYLADRETQVGVAPMWISDKETEKKHIMNNVWAQGESSNSKGQNVPVTTWVFAYDSITTVTE